MIDGTVKSSISFRYSFLVVFTCLLRNKPCRGDQDCDGFGGERTTFEDAFCKLIVWNLVQSLHQFGAD